MAKMEEANAQLASVSDWTCSLDDLMAKPYPSSDTSIANQSSIVFTFEYARLLQTLMRDEFGVTIESGLPMVDDSEIAPGYEEPEESPDQLMVRAGWIENERRKAQTYVDSPG